MRMNGPPAGSWLAAVLIAACGSQPRTPSQGGAPGARAPAAATSGVSNGAQGEAAPDEHLLKEGYRTIKRAGRILYCKPEALTGTRFTSKVCLTANEIREQEARAKDMMHGLNQSREEHCGGKPCVGM